MHKYIKQKFHHQSAPTCSLNRFSEKVIPSIGTLFCRFTQKKSSYVEHVLFGLGAKKSDQASKKSAKPCQYIDYEFKI